MNKTLTAAVNRILIGISASILVSAAAAQGTGAVIESQGFTPGQQARSSSPSFNHDGLSLLLEQNQQLRDELQALRALVERLRRRPDERASRGYLGHRQHRHRLESGRRAAWELHPTNMSAAAHLRAGSWLFARCSPVSWG